MEAATTTPSRTAGVRLTDRDRLIFALTVVRPGTAESLAAATASSLPAVRNRLSALARAGYLSPIVIPGRPKFWFPTAAGFKARHPLGLPADHVSSAGRET